MATVRLLCGPPRSARPATLDALLREHWGRAILLVPTRQYAARRAEAIILEGDSGGAWGTPVMTFDDFAVRLIRSSGKNPVRVRDCDRRLLLERAIARLRGQGGLSELGPAAETAGFVSHMLRTITDIKQAAVEPRDFRVRVAEREGRAPIDTVVAQVYEAYQGALLDAGVYDVPGLFWEADLLCKNGPRGALRNVDALLLDGFDDFTPSEFRLLVSVEKHLRSLVFGLNYDITPTRRDLYALPSRTADAIRERFGPAIESFEEKPAESHAEFASSNLFWRDRPSVPEGLRPDLEIIPCPGFMQEIETVGRRVKALMLDSGAPASEIAVVFRGLREAAPAVRSVFSEFGVPVRVIQEPDLSESAVCSYLLTLFEALESWRRETVVEVLSSPWFEDGVEFADTFPVLSRRAQIVSGRDEWHDRIGRLIERLKSGRGEDIERFLKRIPRALDAAEALRASVETLERLGREFPSRTTPREFAEALDSLIGTAGIEEALHRLPAHGIRDFEGLALASLHRLLGEWVLWYEGDAETLSRHDFLGQLRQAFRETTFRHPASGSGVLCCDADTIRHLRFDYVFFGGANEGDVPRPPMLNAVYSERDVESLRAKGIRIEGRRAHAEREGALFKHLLDAARKHLCITWHTLSRRGLAVLPSPYVNDLKDLFQDTAIEAPMPGPGAFVPSPQHAASWRDLRNAAFAGVPALRKAFAHHFKPADAGAEVVAARHDRSPFGVYDGVLSTLGIVHAIARRFGGEHLFSVQQIETYAACPFSFFVERVLELEEVEVPVSEFDSRVRGSIMHAVLEAFHEQYRGRAVSDIPDEEAAAAMRAALGKTFEDKSWLSSTAPRGVAAIEKSRLAAILERYLAIERKRGESQWKPSHFEPAFGKVKGASPDPLTNPAPYRLDTPGGTVCFAGRIDRIDLNADGGPARIVDYKSSVSVEPADIKAGRSVQLAIYALALEEFLMREVPCAEAFFVQVGCAKRREALGRGKKDEWPEREEIARRAVADAVTGIREGRFTPTPSNKKACAYCAAKRACRHDPTRIERKAAQP